MKHAGKATLANIASLLTGLRAIPGLVERSPGSFYYKSKAYLHFHEDPAGTFADAKLGRLSFERFPVSTKAEQSRLLKRVIEHLAVP